jgi:hypothetical protein
MNSRWIEASPDKKAKATQSEDRSIQYVHTTLRKCLKAAVVDRLITHNPTDGVRLLKSPAGAAEESKGLNPYQVKALLEAALQSRFEALYVVAVHTGLDVANCWGSSRQTWIWRRALAFPPKADTFTLRDASFPYSILLVVSETPVPQ